MAARGTANKKVYAPGDWIVHSNYGVGQITGLERKRLAGEDVLYFRVDGDNGIFWLPVQMAETMDRVRPVASKRRLKEAIKALGEKPDKLELNYKQREARIKETRSESLLVPIAQLVRDMTYWASQKKLTLKEQDTLDELTNRLVKEWSVVSEIQPQKAKSKLHGMQTMTITTKNVTDACIDDLKKKYPHVIKTLTGIEIRGDELDFDSIVDYLRKRGVKIDKLSMKEATLDDVFLKLTGKEMVK